MGGMPIILIHLNIWDTNMSKDLASPFVHSIQPLSRKNLGSQPRIVLSHLKKYLWDKSSQKRGIS
jgi:hypothetical protein